MAGRRQHRSRRRKRACQVAAADTHISSFPDDIVLQIFLRFPSLATLVRAACACRSWRRAVASSPDFRRRFRALHPAPPLLGVFFDTADRCQHPCVPTFAPVRLRDRDLAAAVRGGDFFLTSLYDRPNKNRILDCRAGFVLLSDWGVHCDDETFIVFNPLMRAMRHDEHVSCIVSDDPFTTCSSYGYPDVLQARLVCSDDDPASFRIVILAHGEEDDDDHPRVCASVFSLETGEWSILPWAYVPKGSDDSYVYIVEGTMQSNGSLYWIQGDLKHLVSLDTATMKFSFAELPQRLDQDSTYDAGETKDGDTCIVYSDGFNIGVLIHKRDDDGVERWVLDRVVHMDAEIKRVMRGDLGEDANDLSGLFVFAVRDGYAYMSTTAMSMHPRKPCWFMSLCLETMRLEKLFQRTYDCDAHPYIVSWPPCLTGNVGRFALEAAP